MLSGPQIAHADESMDALAHGGVAAAWATTDGPTPVVGLSAPARDVLVSLECRARFGPLAFAWVEGPYAVPAETSLDVAHPLASSYVTDLLVQAVEVGADGAPGQETAVPDAFVLWIDGEGGQPVVWSQADLATHAPAGVVDSVLADAVLVDPGLARQRRWTTPRSSARRSRRTIHPTRSGCRR